MDFLAAFQPGTTDLDVLNRVFLILLSKKDAVTAATNFRPVSLKNCAPKIASKVMTTRLQQHITKIFAPHQTGFIKGRCITSVASGSHLVDPIDDPVYPVKQVLVLGQPST